MLPVGTRVTERAVASHGASSEAIYRMVERALAQRHQGRGTILDIGCGRGDLSNYVGAHFDEYIGADVMRYDTFPSTQRFLEIDLDSGQVPLPDESAEVVVAVETIEHLENPRAFVRELCRLTKPGGLVIVTTPNQLSLLSLLTLLTKRQFNAFQEAPGLYPAHLTALLEIDLLRIARECGLTDCAIAYSDCGRVPFSVSNWSRILGGGRLWSDNVLLSASKPADETRKS